MLRGMGLYGIYTGPVSKGLKKFYHIEGPFIQRIMLVRGSVVVMKMQLFYIRECLRKPFLKGYL